MAVKKSGQVNDGPTWCEVCRQWFANQRRFKRHLPCLGGRVVNPQQAKP